MKPAAMLLLVALGGAGAYYILKNNEQYKSMHILTNADYDPDFKYKIVIDETGKQTDVKVAVPVDDSYTYRGNTYARS